MNDHLSSDDKGGLVKIPGDRAVFQVSDVVETVRNAGKGILSFDRHLDMPGRGFRWDAPGARVRFRTDSPVVIVELNYTSRHIGEARNGVGFYRVDGRGEATWRFNRPAGTVVPGEAVVRFPLPVPPDGGFHDYELIFPYADSVELLGAFVVPGARWSDPSPRPPTRYVAFGDSVTQGFTASDVTRTYPFRVGEAKRWQVVNAGFGGRGARAEDGDFLAGLEAEIFSVAIGVNDWQGGTELESFGVALAGLLGRLRAGRPTAAIHVITPLWVPPSWNPATVKYPLEDYRLIAREVAERLEGGPLNVVAGQSLIDPDASLFDVVAVHPNDAGLAQMAARLVSVFNR